MGKRRKTEIRPYMKLEKFKHLNFNWDGYGAKEISLEVIERVKSIIDNFTSLPDIIPGSQNSIQLEFSKSNGDYLEIEIFKDKIEMYKIISGSEEESSIGEEDIFRLEKQILLL